MSRIFESQYLRFFFFLFLLLLISYPIFVLIYYWGVFGLFNYITNTVVNTTGVSPYLVKALVILFLAPLVVFFGFGLSLSSKKRKIARIIIAFYAVIFYSGMFLLTKDQKFDFDTGESIKYYAVTPEGIRYFDNPGFDPKYGIPLKPIDQGIAARDLKRAPLQIDDPSQFFCHITREPLIWYYESTDGSIEFYDMPGYHPIYGEELKPITRDVISRYQSLKRERIKAEIEEQEQARIKEKQIAEERKRRIAQEQEQARIKEKQEEIERQRQIIVLKSHNVPDNPYAKAFHLKADIGDTIELMHAVRVNFFAIFSIGNKIMGKYRNGIVPAKTPFLIDKECSKNASGEYFELRFAGLEPFELDVIKIRHIKAKK